MSRVSSKKKSILENKEELLKQKKKRKRIKRTIVFLIVLITILITLCLKLPYFNVATITVEGNENLTKEYIMETSKITTGKNIFLTKKREAVKNIKNNPYALSVKIKTTLPNKINIEVSERQASFYIKVNKEFYVIDKDGIVLEKTKKIQNPNLIYIKDLEYEKIEVGSAIKLKKTERIDTLKNLCNVIYSYNQTQKRKINMIELNKFVDIKLYCGSDLYINIGTEQNLNEKLTKAMNILKNENLNNMKGYVDVSFEGNPVIYRK